MLIAPHFYNASSYEFEFETQLKSDMSIIQGVNPQWWVPRLIVDGKELSWQEFGRMLMEYEGWHFKLEIFEVTEERQIWMITKSTRLNAKR